MLIKKDNNINYIIGLSGELDRIKNNLTFVNDVNKCLQIYKKDNDLYYYLFNANKSKGFNDLLEYYIAKQSIRNSDVLYDFLISKISAFTCNSSVANWEKYLLRYIKVKNLIFHIFNFNEIKKIKNLLSGLEKDWINYNPNLVKKNMDVNINKDKLYNILTKIPYDDKNSYYLIMSNYLKHDITNLRYNNDKDVYLKGLVEYISAISIDKNYHKLLNDVKNEKHYFKQTIMYILSNSETDTVLKNILVNNYNDIIKLFRYGDFLKYIYDENN